MNDVVKNPKHYSLCINRIFDWQLKMKIFENGSKNEQFLKIMEEIDELSISIINNNLHSIMGKVGDVYVSLISYKMTFDTFDRVKGMFYLVEKYSMYPFLEVANVLNVDDKVSFLKVLIKLKYGLQEGVSYSTVNEFFNFLVVLCEQYKIDFIYCLEYAVEKLNARNYCWEGKRLVRTN